MLKGHCQCGAVRYETDGTPSWETNCHCSICRRSSGAPYVAWFSVPAAQFRFVAGTPSQYRSSEHGTRTFCGQCGTPLTFISDRNPAEIDITISSLDDPEALPPRDHTRTVTKLSWVRIDDGLPTYPVSRQQLEH